MVVVVEIHPRNVMTKVVDWSDCGVSTHADAFSVYFNRMVCSGNESNSDFVPVCKAHGDRDVDDDVL